MGGSMQGVAGWVAGTGPGWVGPGIAGWEDGLMDGKVWLVGWLAEWMSVIIMMMTTMMTMVKMIMHCNALRAVQCKSARGETTDVPVMWRRCCGRSSCPGWC
eukprot:8209440-Karenia_brevis.AAC.1